VRQDVGLVRGLSGALGGDPEQEMKGTGTLILCYHRVADPVDDPFHLCVHPKNFAAHLEELARGREPCTLDELGSSSGRPKAVVTFDDGYADNLTEALPIAEAKGIPITVFVTSGMLDSTEGFWWDRLGRLLRAWRTRNSGRTRSIEFEGTTVSLGGRSYREDLGALRRALVPLSVPQIERELDDMADALSVRPGAVGGARPLTSPELLELASSELVSIGAHTIDHVRLQGRRRDEQEHTIAKSKKDLEHLLGRAVPHFAYPFGRRDDFDDATVETVRMTGFDTACTALAGSAYPTSNRYLLPRRLVMDWGRARFRAQLLRWRLW
jgi:peptidoglycan/xylan/chitin deacetylase (PgdA/CDA1 family)